MSIDGSAFKNIEEIWPHIKVKPCNLRVSLVVDAVIQFGELISTY